MQVLRAPSKDEWVHKRYTVRSKTWKRIEKWEQSHLKDMEKDAIMGVKVGEHVRLTVLNNAQEPRGKFMKVEVVRKEFDQEKNVNWISFKIIGAPDEWKCFINDEIRTRSPFYRHPTSRTIEQQLHKWQPSRHKLDETTMPSSSTASSTVNRRSKARRLMDRLANGNVPADISI